MPNFAAPTRAVKLKSGSCVAFSCSVLALVVTFFQPGQSVHVQSTRYEASWFPSDVCVLSVTMPRCFSTRSPMVSASCVVAPSVMASSLAKVSPSRAQHLLHHVARFKALHLRLSRGTWSPRPVRCSSDIGECAMVLP